MSDDDDWGPGGAASSSESDAMEDIDDSDDDGGRKKKKKGGSRGGKGGGKGGKGGGGRKKKDAPTKGTATKRKAPASKKGKADEGAKRGGKKAKGGGGGAERKKPTPEKEAPSILIDYLKAQNRPYNLQQIYDNLLAQHQFKKPLVQKTLETLTEKGDIQSKEFGKSVCYYYNQEKLPQVPLEKLGELDEKIDTLSNELCEVRQQNRQSDTENKEIEKRATIKEIDDLLTKTATKVKQKTEKIKKLKSGAIKLVDKSVADQARVDFLKEFQSMKKLRGFGITQLDDLLGEAEIKMEEFAASMRVDTDQSAAFEFQKWSDIANKAEQLTKKK